MKSHSCGRRCAGVVLFLAAYWVDVSAVRIASDENATMVKQVERVARAVVKKFGLSDDSAFEVKTSGRENDLLEANATEAVSSAFETTLVTWIDCLLFPLKPNSLPMVVACVVIWICLKMFILCGRSMAEDFDSNLGQKECRFAEPVTSAKAAEDESSESESEDDVCLPADDKADDVTKVDRFFDEHWEDLVQRLAGPVKLCKRQGFFRMERFLAISAVSDRNLRSSLAWWTDMEAYASGKQPLDGILLQQISSVREEHNGSGQPGVVVWYWREDENTRLNILFSSVEAAEAFSQSLTELLTRLIRRNRLATKKE